jgi:hypothetical protein
VAIECNQAAARWTPLAAGKKKARQRVPGLKSLGEDA